MNRKSYLGIASGIYALFYSFCLYKNLGGATFPFFVIGTLLYIMLCMKEFGVIWKKDSIFVIAVTFLIALSQIFTANETIQGLNVAVVFTLLIYVILHQFAFDEKWNMLQTLENILLTFFGGITHFFAPVKDFSNHRKASVSSDIEDKKKKLPVYIVLLTIIVCLPPLAIVVSLLSSADAVFSHMWDNLFNIVLPEMNWWKPLFLSLFVFFFTYGMLTNLLKFPFSGEEKEINKKTPLIPITAGIMFDAVYLIFSVIQILYLFIGKFALPEGYTYAEYAREGYFQLLFVCLLNIVMVFAGIYLFEENRLLKTVLTILSACTYIMMASSAFRMILYIRYYYFTFERIFVLWSLVLLALLLTGLVVQIWKKNFKLFKYSVTVCCICYLVLAFGKPDFCIAKWNLANEEVRDEFFMYDSYNDYYYLTHYLSADAAPLLLENKNVAEKYPDYRIDLQLEEVNVRNFNYSIYKAKKLAGK